MQSCLRRPAHGESMNERSRMSTISVQAFCAAREHCADTVKSDHLCRPGGKVAKPGTLMALMRHSKDQPCPSAGRSAKVRIDICNLALLSGRRAAGFHATI